MSGASRAPQPEHLRASFDCPQPGWPVCMSTPVTTGLSTHPSTHSSTHPPNPISTVHPGSYSLCVYYTLTKDPPPRPSGRYFSQGDGRTCSPYVLRLQYGAPSVSCRNRTPKVTTEFSYLVLAPLTSYGHSMVCQVTGVWLEHQGTPQIFGFFQEYWRLFKLLYYKTVARHTKHDDTCSYHRFISTFVESVLPIFSPKCPTNVPRFENISMSDVGIQFLIYDDKLILRRRISLICEVLSINDFWVIVYVSFQTLIL